MAALQWIRHDDSKVPYVKNCVAEIKEIQSDSIFNHVKTNSNPADLLSRGTLLKKVTEESLWFQGPDWLNNEETWREQQCQNMNDCSHVGVVLENSKSRETHLIEVEIYSSLGKLLRVTSKVLKFITNVFKRLRWTCTLLITDPTIFWIKKVQNDVYNEEKLALKRIT